jgi:hypothetical protein
MSEHAGARQCWQDCSVKCCNGERDLSVDIRFDREGRSFLLGIHV